MRTVTEIDTEIEAKRAALNAVSGRETEVYSRIVGYYRSLRNWNVGKKAEFGERKTYDALASLSRRDRRSEGRGDDATPISFQLFTRTRCPGCAAAKTLFGTLPAAASRLSEIDVDSPDGLRRAEAEMIAVTPTLIARDDAGHELWRSSDPLHMRDLLAPAG